jgi:hypothetical protein
MQHIFAFGKFSKPMSARPAKQHLPLSVRALLSLLKNRSKIIQRTHRHVLFLEFMELVVQEHREPPFTQLSLILSITWDTQILRKAGLKLAELILKFTILALFRCSALLCFY